MSNENTTPVADAVVVPESDSFIEAALQAAEDERRAHNGTPAPEGQDEQPEPKADTATAKKERPESVPEKFWDAEKGEIKQEELLKSYQELEKKQGTKEEPAPEKAKEAKEQLEQAGIAPDALTTEFAQTGDISEDSRAKAAEALKAVFGDKARAYVDAYVEGQQAKAAAENSAAALEIYAAVGGEQNMAALQDWVSKNKAGLDATTLDAAAVYDEAIYTGNLRTAKLALRTVFQAFDAVREKGGDGTLEGSVPSGGGAGAGGVYADMDEYQADLADPRYRSDEDFRAAVDRKLDRSVF